ncbi:hypothetical protein BYI23_E002010 (plasmid) [Burkholderia sp. YI23]|nr:hypothetical protein BYI23_E002010 [Burkholderia sp. YI23]
MTMPGDLHQQLVRLGASWVRRQGFGVVATEISVTGCREQPDVIAFRQQCSVIIEAKASRTDFLADSRKPERNHERTGLGVYRFYICPPNVIAIADLPDGWGLLHVDGKKVTEVVRPSGNAWPAFGRALPQFPAWGPFQHQPNLEAERAVLFSIARRLSTSAPAIRRPLHGIDEAA